MAGDVPQREDNPLENAVISVFSEHVGCHPVFMSCRLAGKRFDIFEHFATSFN